MTWPLLQNSLLFAGLSALLALLFGLAAALSLAVLDGRWKGVGVSVAALALALPPFLVANCWLDLLGTTGRWRSWLPLSIYDLRSAAFVMALMLWPIPLFAALGAWQRLETAHLEVEPRLTGWRLLRHLLLPVAWPALATATVLAFVLGLASFALPAIFQVKVFAVEIWLRFSTNFDYPGAFAASLPVVIAPVLAWLWLRKTEVAWPRWQGVLLPRLLRRRLGPAVWVTAGALAALVAFLSVALPLGQIVTNARTWIQLGPALAAGGVAVWSSFWLAALTATLTVAVGLAGWRWRFGPALWLPFLFPGVFLGLGLIWALNRGPLVALYQSVFVALVALGVRYLGLGWQTAALAWRTADPDLVDAVRLAGGSPWQVLRLAIWPAIARPLLAGWYVVYLLCLWDIETLVLIVPPGLETLSLRIFNLLHYGHNPQVNALCLALLGLALLPPVLWLAGRGVGVGFGWARAGWSRTHRAAVAFALLPLLLAGCTDRSDRPELESRFFSRVEVIGTRGRGPGQFNKPRSLAVDREDNLYVVDMTGRVQKFAPDGAYLLSWQMPETDLGRAKGMALDREGTRHRGRTPLLAREPLHARRQPGPAMGQARDERRRAHAPRARSP